MEKSKNVSHKEPDLPLGRNARQDHPSTASTRKIVKNILSDDGTRVYGYDPETKLQSFQWNTNFFEKKKPDSFDVKLLSFLI